MSVLLRRRPRHGELTIEPLRRRHLPGVLPIERVSYPRPWTEGIFHQEIDLSRRGERYYVAALLGREVVGYAGLMFAPDDAHVTNIAVAAAARRSRLGSRLLAELALEARRRRVTAMTLEVRVSNVAAQAMYQQFGFTSAGVRQRYYENTEDAIVMWCTGIDEPEYFERLRRLSPEACR